MLNRLNRITILFYLWLLCSLGLLLSPLQMQLVDAEEVTPGEIPANCSTKTSCCSESESPDSSSISTEAVLMFYPLPQANCCEDGSTGNSCNSTSDECDHTCFGCMAGIQHALSSAFVQIHPPQLNHLLPDTCKSDLSNCWHETLYRPPTSLLSLRVHTGW
jgi:hypothetical protein